MVAPLDVAICEPFLQVTSLSLITFPRPRSQGTAATGSGSLWELLKWFQSLGGGAPKRSGSSTSAPKFKFKQSGASDPEAINIESERHGGWHRIQGGGKRLLAGFFKILARIEKTVRKRRTYRQEPIQQTVFLS
jgi:hypothetical protein